MNLPIIGLRFSASAQFHPKKKFGTNDIMSSSAKFAEVSAMLATQALHASSQLIEGLVEVRDSLGGAAVFISQLHICLTALAGMSFTPTFEPTLVEA